MSLATVLSERRYRWASISFGHFLQGLGFSWQEYMLHFHFSPFHNHFHFSPAYAPLSQLKLNAPRTILAFAICKAGLSNTFHFRRWNIFSYIHLSRHSLAGRKFPFRRIHWVNFPTTTMLLQQHILCFIWIVKTLSLSFWETFSVWVLGNKWTFVVFWEKCEYFFERQRAFSVCVFWNKWTFVVFWEKCE